MSSTRIEADREIKGLRSQIAAKRGDLTAAKTNISSAQRQAASLERQIQAMDARIKELEQPTEAGPIIVTEHAMLRYLERVKGVNLDELKSEIVDGAEASIRFMRDGELQRPQGHALVVKGLAIVTIKGGVRC